MRIAFSGAHATGKSTLIAELARRLPDYVVREEPFYALDAEGVVFAANPTAHDFALMLQRSCAMLRAYGGEDLLLDRCPIDYLGYLATSRDNDPDLMPRRVARVTDAMKRVDLVVYVPIEKPDRIGVSSDDKPRLRRRVDGTLREMLVEDSWGLNARVIEVSGTIEQRMNRVLAEIGS